MQGLVEDLRAQLGELRETHISWVFLGETRVLKVKKPVDFGFLDFRTLAARKVACDAELLLNRRLAPDVYLQVLPIHRDATGVHRIGGTGELVDWAVEMQRLPDEDGCDRRLAAGRLTRAQLVAVGERLAHFHAQARSDANTERFGAPETILGNVRENFEQTQDSAPMHLSSAQLKDLQSYQLRFLEAQRERLERRVAMHRVRDGHGDLRLEHVYIGDDGVIRVIDCIEFNERFRYADVCADLAFLTMDLRWHERADLAETLLAAYARESNDFDLYRLVDFYESYRAYVRAKVESFVERDASASQATRERAAAQARKHYLLALASARPALQVPFLCAVGGLIASGKSTLAEQLGAELCVPIVDADRTRKHLAHVQPTERLDTTQFGGAYSPEASLHVYEEVRARADAVLASGRPVVVDASFRSRAEREALRALAQQHGVPFHFVECRAPLDTCRQRLRARAEQGGVSDAREPLLDAFAARYEPVVELPPSSHLTIDTTCELSRNVRAVIARLRAS